MARSRPQLPRPRLQCVAVVLLLLTWTLPSIAFSPPEGPVILTISGHPDGPDRIEFDRDQLTAMGAVEFTTSTIWTEGLQRFRGVPLAALLAHLDVAPAQLRLVAQNDYAVDMPVETISAQAPILAYSLNDAPMSLRGRGPIWLVYPYDSDPNFRTEVIFSRSVWQLVRIEILH